MPRKLLSLAFPFLIPLEDHPMVSVGEGADGVALQMNEEEFRAFYEKTSRSLWTYLAHATGNANAADDLLQETYFRLLRARATFETEEHRRYYLFRIATNLVRDGHRRPRADRYPIVDEAQIPSAGDHAGDTDRRTDVQRAMDKLKPRERDLLWLAYGQGSSHEEIAGSLGLRTGSVKPLLFRARRKLAALLGGYVTKERRR